MKKIPTIFVRNPENMRNLLDEQHPDCGWVFAGEGVATRKYDGTCCKIEHGKLWKRREVKPGKQIPSEFVEEQFDSNTGKRVGWMPVNCNEKQDQYHCKAFVGQPEGTYELLGPKVQGNPEGLKFHILKAHSDAVVFKNCPRTFEGLRSWLAEKNIEGVVFHHPDGRMAKIKKRDFSMHRIPNSTNRIEDPEQLNEGETMKIKKGASIQGLDIKMRPALIVAEIIWKQLGQELVVTSGLDGEHSAGSLHYYGLALDFRTRYFSADNKQAAASHLKNALGADYDVILHSSHIHVEYDKDLRFFPT